MHNGVRLRYFEKKAAKCCKIIAEGLENLATAAISARKCHGYGLWVIFQFFGTFFLSRYLWYLQYFTIFLQYFVKKKYRTKNCGCNIFRHLEQTYDTCDSVYTAVSVSHGWNLPHISLGVSLSGSKRIFDFYQVQGCPQPLKFILSDSLRVQSK